MGSLWQRARGVLSDRGPGGRGQAMVEFAIAFPLQLFITFAIAQLILIYVSTLIVNFAAYRACRAAIVGGDPHAAAGVVLAPITTGKTDGFSVDPNTAQSIPGWGTIRNSDVARAKSLVYTVSDPDSQDVTVVVEYHQELMFPVVDGLFALFLADPNANEDQDQRTFGHMEVSNSTEPLYGKEGGPFIREFGGVKYLVIIRECTMYRQEPANENSS